MLALVMGGTNLWAQTKSEPIEFSTAGFYTLPSTGRTVLNLNPGWRFHKGEIEGGGAADKDDREWERVNLPHGIELLPSNASGCVNYQGVVWYRKHFVLPDSLSQKRLLLHFEAIMGKSRVYVNGHEVAHHFGGYLPISVDITPYVKQQGDNVLAVWADNSDDGTYPPGKPQAMLDFAYFGGIYRDCFLVAHNDVFISDANSEEIVGGGGVVVDCEKVSDKEAVVAVKVHLKNLSAAAFHGQLVGRLLWQGEEVESERKAVKLSSAEDGVCQLRFCVKQPHLWSPSDPSLYDLTLKVRKRHGEVVDGYRLRVGIRSFSFRGKDGFYLNGKAYDGPLVGANRHQDYAYIGNALSNNLHWRDAWLLRNAGLKVIRNAHCPQDPAFLDACDALGLLVINNTPGWQYWNDAPEFAARVYSDIRHLVRRDRNHACMWLWEPILNETWYPADFAARARAIVDEELPSQSTYSACDNAARGSEVFPIRFEHAPNGNVRNALKELNDSVCYFTREWGDNVDDWTSHNSPSRVALSWGEVPMLVQAQHYAHPPYQYTSMESLYRTSRQHVGGCLWHSFDHQRGYHPDPFYGGLMDVFRRPKYAYYMFASQRSPQRETRCFETGPVLYLAHAMTPFSPAAVTLYTNCDSVRLKFCKDGAWRSVVRQKREAGMPSPIIKIDSVYDFMVDKHYDMDLRRGKDVFIETRGYVDGKEVAVDTVRPSRRPTQLQLYVDNARQEILADGSQVVQVFAAITDEMGTVKRLNKQSVLFEVEGEAELLGDASILANPAPIEWGTAAALIRTTMRAGQICIRARVLKSGKHTPISGKLVLTSVACSKPLLYDKEELPRWGKAHRSNFKEGKIKKERDEQKKRKKELEKVEQQQKEFGETH